MTDPNDLAICATCGIQYPSPSVPNCKICDDPRQYIPPTGQTWTTLRTLHESHSYKNIITPDPHNPNLFSIHTVPKVGIGQRALLCKTSSGKNILWDCLTYLDHETIAQINELGGLHAIVISHPHYFATNLVWAEAFGCPVYLAAEDVEWVVRRRDDNPQTGAAKRGQVLWSGKELTLADGDIVVIKTGGHFPGSSVLWWRSERKLLLADTILTVPSGIYHVDRLPGTASFTFMWSYPNMIPLPPDEVHSIWKAIKHTEFEDAHAGFVGLDVRGNSKKRVLESAQIFIRAMGYQDHAIHQETCD